MPSRKFKIECSPQREVTVIFTEEQALKLIELLDRAKLWIPFECHATISGLSEEMALALDSDPKEIADKLPSEPPRQVSVDGMTSPDGQGGIIEYIGNATEQPDGKFRCLANIHGTLSIVEVDLTFPETSL